MDIEETTRGLMRGTRYRSGRLKSFIHQDLFIALFESRCGCEVLTAIILCFHGRSRVGLGIDRLMFDRLADELKRLEEC